VISNVIVSGVPVEETKRRMWLNWDYDPSNHIEWNSECHPMYTLMGEDERTGRMWKAAMTYKYKGWRGSKDWKIAYRAVLLADLCKARYADWCLSQVAVTGSVGMPVIALTGKYATSNYCEWVRKGKRVSEITKLLLSLDKYRVR
jgi:hypothetical protein